MNLPNFGDPRLTYPMVRKAPGDNGIRQAVFLDGAEIYARNTAGTLLLKESLYQNAQKKLEHDAAIAAFKSAEAAALAAAQGES